MSGIRQPEVVRTENSPAVRTRLYKDVLSKDAVTVIYTEDGDAYTYDAAGDVDVDADDMFALFLNGVVAVKDDVYYKPTSCTEDGTIVFPFGD